MLFCQQADILTNGVFAILVLTMEEQKCRLLGNTLFPHWR